MTEPVQITLSLRIHEHADALSPTDRQIADLILNFPGEIASYSAIELAKMAGTSNAAISRFVQRLGFRNYEEMKHHARDMRTSGFPVYLLEKETVKDLPSQIERHVRVSSENISDTFGSMDPTVISAAVDGIVSARRVIFLGMRNGHFLAKYLRWQISEVHPRTELLPNDGETIAETLAGLTEQDVVVIFAIRRLVPMVRSVLNLVGSLKARTLFITDQHYREKARPTWEMKCATRSPSPLDNHVAVLLLCHLIADEAIRISGDAGRSRLNVIEDLHNIIGEI